MKKILPFLIVINLVITIFISNSATGLRESEDEITFYVDDNFNNNTIGWKITHFNNIQEAINTSNDGNIIVICEGLYYENLIVKKSITLQSDNYSIIDGEKSIGLLIKANNTIVKKLNFTNCSIGIKIYNNLFSVNNITIFKNNIYNNMVGIILNDSSNNTLYHNNFFNNTYQGYDNSTNIWYNSIFLKGNYWDDYNGSDKNSDGIGDEPYKIPGGNNSDEYPLMMPFANEIITEFQVDEELLYRMLIVAMVAAILFVLPLGYIWYRKHHNK